MAHIKQRGILDSSTNPRQDANVIMTAAIVGHAYARLSSNKNCAFDVEADSRGKKDKELADDWNAHINGVAKINKALATMGGLYGIPGKGKEAIVGVTPHYNPAGGIARITAGSGDLPLDSPYRYAPPMPADLAGAKLYALALTPGTGYQGRGAYTGFVQGREDGQTDVFSTYRHRIPDDQGRRWIPSDTAGIEPAIGTLPNERIWGMIGSNATQEPIDPTQPLKQPNDPKATLKEQGMHFQDRDSQRGAAVTLGKDDIVGYTHGMVQAIYDVVWRKATTPRKRAGTPYEIAVGDKTTKLASCFTCSIFMQANNFPASATHLGRGESWCPLYPEGEDSSTLQNRARSECNEKWAAYCKTIIDAGIKCIEGRVNDGHAASFAKLKTYVAGKSARDYANLVLDAVTVHDNEITRVNNTLKP